MHTTARITTNIEHDLLLYLDERAKFAKESRRGILESALRFYRREMKRQEIMSGMNEMAKNKEEMAEWLEIANHPHNLSLPLGFDL